MTGNNPSDLLFVINPSAGNNTVSWEDIIHNFFTGKNFSIEYFLLPPSPGDNKLKNYIQLNKPKMVIAVGGDGTVTMIANILSGTGTALGILPAGSANGMARELGIPTDPLAALEIIARGFIKCCDAIKINEDFICVHLSDIGLNAQLIKYFDEGKLRGKLGYAKVILKTLWHKEKMQVIIHMKDLEVRRNAFMVVLANASMYGTGAVINPQGQLDDGSFEVIIVRRLSFIALFKMLLRPGTFNPKHIEIFPSTAVEIYTMKKVHFQVDGEYMGKTKQVTARVLPGNILLVLPAPKGA